MPEVPARMVLLGNSGQGKTLCAQNMLLKHYRGCFVAIHILLLMGLSTNQNSFFFACYEDGK